MNQATYRIEQRLDGTLIGDVSEIAENLTWRKGRTNSGVDEIDFTLNDHIFADWCAERNTTIQNMLKPYALDARIVRNGEDIVGGFLATMPAYQPKNDSADLQLRFDGYMNLLAGVYIRPTPTMTLPAGQMVKTWIDFAESKADGAGKPFGITAGSIQELATIQESFDNYKTVKEAIVQRCDNVNGAGPFDVIFNPDRSYYITNQLGRNITGWQITYPATLHGHSAMTINAQEVQGFASHIIALGAGETSSDPEKSTVAVAESTDTDAVLEFGYVEQLNQYSSISRQATLNTRADTDLSIAKAVQWNPQITLNGRQIPPSPTAEYGLWIGDQIWLENTADMTGQTSGKFRINIIEVRRSATGGETITPTMERIA